MHEDSYTIIAVFNTPLGLTVELDAETLDSHVIKHGSAWVSVDQARLVFEQPARVYHTQHDDMHGVLLFYRQAEITTPSVKLVCGVADFRYGPVGRVLSIHPKQGIPTTVTDLVYSTDEETTDANE